MLKRIISAVSASAVMFLMSISCFAETTVGESSGVIGDSTVIGDSALNVPTGVNLDWVPLAICGGVLVVAGIVYAVMTILKKKKK